MFVKLENDDFENKQGMTHYIKAYDVRYSNNTL